MTVDFEHNSAAELFAAVCKAFEKKRTRVITSLIMLPAAVFFIRELHSGWYILDNTWLSYLLTVLLFAAAMLSGGVLVSCVGNFKRWKFFTGASVSAVLLWSALGFLSVYCTLMVADYEEIPDYIVDFLKYTAPMLLTALCLTLLAGAFVTCVKKYKV